MVRIHFCFFASLSQNHDSIQSVLEFAALLQRPGLFAASRPVDAADFRAFVTRLAATLRLAVVAHSSSPKVSNQYHRCFNNIVV